MTTLDFYLRGNPSGRGAALCAALLVGVGAVDYSTGDVVNLAILYLAPVFLAAWMFGSRAGVMVSVLSTALWYFSIESPPSAHSRMLAVWEAAIQFATFAIFAFVIAKLKTVLSHADERFATVLEGFDVAVYVTDAASGELLYSNEPFGRTFSGREPPSLPPGRSEGEVQDDLGRWFLLHVRPLRWTDARMARLHVATDITERRRGEELYRQQQEKLALTARLVAVGEMATTLAHELNQPLAAIVNYYTGCARRLRSGDWDALELAEAMEKGAAQAERASSVIRRLREFIARRQPALVACDINEVVRGVRGAIEADARERSVRLVLALSERIPYARADQTLMEQVVLNLARNAIDAMEETPADERELLIRSRNGEESTIEVEVADRGRGIDAELERNLFSPFFSTKPDGMGLGLHISRSIVEAHGGHLWVTRNEKRGMVFHFSLQSVYA